MSIQNKSFDFKKFIQEVAGNLETSQTDFPNGHIFSISEKEINDFMTSMENEDLQTETNHFIKYDNEAYPIMDVTALDETAIEILLSLPGFLHSEISIKVEDTTLIIEGQPTELSIELTKNNTYIIIKPFIRYFSIPAGAEIWAKLNSGLLTIIVSEIEQQPKNYIVPIQ